MCIIIFLADVSTYDMTLQLHWGASEPTQARETSSGPLVSPEMLEDRPGVHTKSVMELNIQKSAILVLLKHYPRF